MNEQSKMTRRTMLRAGAGMTAGAMAGTVLGGALDRTPPNPEGPFYPKHEQLDKDTDLTLIEGHPERAAGSVIEVRGRVLDESGAPIEGALVDIWQANTYGRYHHEDDPNPAPRDPNFQGWGMVRTDADGRYSFKTIKPGSYGVDEEWTRPPHIHYKVSRRGYHELTTQMYFEGEALNEDDALLNAVPESQRGRLVVSFSEDQVPVGRFDIVLQDARPA
jgi:protocatechuate 3,4-dioxygenase beta subunit